LPVTSPENREATAGLTTSRIGALSDSVFAVVFTLMVFQIRLPDLPASRPPGELARHLRALWPEFLSYVLSFIIAGCSGLATTTYSTTFAARTGCSSG
jgi:uncharacterized membrane protein